MHSYYPILDLDLEKWNGTYLLWHAWVNADPKLDYLIASSKQNIVGYNELRNIYPSKYVFGRDVS